MPEQRTLDEEKNALRAVLNRFVTAQAKRLIDKAEQGYLGWDNPEYTNWICNKLFSDAQFLADNKVVDPRIYIDIANRAMMLWAMQEGKEQQETGND